jgi:hypothetical protein
LRLGAQSSYVEGVKLAPVLLFLATASASVMARAENRLGQLRGRILDSLTRAPIAGVSIEISERNLHQITDSGGHFRVVALPPGQYVIHARRFGYHEAFDTVQIQQGDSTEREFVLRRVTQELRKVVISGRAVTFPRFFEAAYKRASGGRGSFFTREDIEQLNANDYQTLLNRIAGVSANERGVTFQRCQSGLEVLGRPGSKPKVQVWLDGHRVTLDSGDGAGVYAALRTVNLKSIQIMEIYTGVSNIPADFLADACAVILIWTKRD